MLFEAWPQSEPELAQAALAGMKWGKHWVRERNAFIGAAGIGLTNVFAFRPPNNKIEPLCAPHKATNHGRPPLLSTGSGRYLKDEFLPELERLYIEIDALRPNLIVALGNTAAWAVLNATGINSIRGSVAHSIPIRGRTYKVLPTYHPAGVLRNWAWRPIVVADLIKALRESETPELIRPVREVLVNPSLAEVEQWTTETLTAKPLLLSCDIETIAKQIKCIGFARSRSEAMVVPFFDPARPGASYWGSLEEERFAWQQVIRLLHSGIPKLFQNGMYDLQYICRMGIRPRACLQDTMLLHHSLFPELQKGLGFLGSIYTNEASWKLMRRRKTDTEKRDE